MLAHPDLSARAIATSLQADQLREDVPDLRIPSDLRNQAYLQARRRMEEGNCPEFYVTDDSFGRKAYPPNQGQPPRTLWLNAEVGHNRAGKSETKALFPEVTPFTTPKGERLLERIIHISTNLGDVVLDCFAGSGVTAAVGQKWGGVGLRASFWKQHSTLLRVHGWKSCPEWRSGWSHDDYGPDT